MSLLGELRGVIFDMDGTLVDSQLDFDAIRTELGLKPGLPILEQLAQLSPEDQAACHDVLHRHERQGADRATLIAGAHLLLESLRRQDIKMAILTRNSRAVTQYTLERLAILSHFDCLVCREDGPHKPDPWAIHEICRRWQIDVQQVVMVGDFELDILAAHHAGCRSLLFTNGLPAECVAGHHLATVAARDFVELQRLLAPALL